MKYVKQVSKMTMSKKGNLLKISLAFKTRAYIHTFPGSHVFKWCCFDAPPAAAGILCLPAPPTGCMITLSSLYTCMLQHIP